MISKDINQDCINSLKDLGCSTVFYSPGGQNASLIEVIKKNNYFKAYNILDERSLPFLCLGFYKKTNLPSALITTSGSAVLNLIPGLAEAKNLYPKIILITCDRCHSEVRKQCPQTINHQESLKLFSHSYTENPNFGTTTNSYSYPLHVNLRYKNTSNDTIHSSSNDPLDLLILNEKQHNTDSEVLNWIKSYNGYVINEIYSDIQTPSAQNITDLELMSQMQPLNILSIGDIPTSSYWRRAQSKNKIYRYQKNFKKLGHVYAKQIKKEELINLKFKLNKSLKPNNNSRIFPRNSEIAICSDILKLIPNHSNLIVANSSPIRWFNHLKNTGSLFKDNINIYCNRNINGIDGLISTAIGIHLSDSQKLTYLIIGDQSFLYNINCLEIVANYANHNFKIIILQNFGGGIFTNFTSKEISNRKHNFTFQQVSQNFQLNYTQNLVDFENNQIIELICNNEQTYSFVQKIKQGEKYDNLEKHKRI